MSGPLPDPKPGDPIYAEHVRQLLEIRRALRVRVAPPLAQMPDGTIYLPDSGGFWAKITGAPTSGKHPWQQVVGQSGGTWANGAASGTTSDDPAYEVNGSTATLTNKYVWMWREPASGEMRFIYSTC